MKQRSRMMEQCMGQWKKRSCFDFMKKKDFPYEKCKFPENHSFAEKQDNFSTPELRGLFDDWLALIEEEVVEFSRTQDIITAEKIADRFRISKESAIFILSKLAKESKINTAGD